LCVTFILLVKSPSTSSFAVIPSNGLKVVFQFNRTLEVVPVAKIKSGSTVSTTAFFSYIAFTSKLLVTLTNGLFQPINVYPSTSGALGAVALAPFSTVSSFNTVLSKPRNLTV
jgi:hypothetical protein